MRPSRFLFSIFKRAVPGDPVNPGGQGTLAAKGTDIFQDKQPGLLGCFFGGIIFPDDPFADRRDHPAVFLRDNLHLNHELDFRTRIGRIFEFRLS
jgi:hypothetical protein